MSSELSVRLECAEHRSPVVLGRWESGLIRHQDGSFCDGTQFEAGVLSRAQAMALLFADKGEHLTDKIGSDLLDQTANALVSLFKEAATRGQ